MISAYWKYWVAALLVVQSTCLLFSLRRPKQTNAISSAERKAVFRLGQMDMKASVCDMLRVVAKKNEGKTGCLLTLAADMVESMEVPGADA